MTGKDMTKICECNHTEFTHWVNKRIGRCKRCPCKKFKEKIECSKCCCSPCQCEIELDIDKKPKGCGKMLRMAFDCGDIIGNKLILCDDCKKPAKNK